MKKVIFILATLSILFAAAPIYGQKHVLEAEIPFEFSVKNRTFAAGEYALDQPTDNGGQRLVWMLTGEKEKVLLLAKSKRSANAKDRYGLIFNRYGDRYFLSSFVALGMRIKLRTSKEEIKIRKQRDRLLGMAGPRETVVVEGTSN